jgi:hypothetical protein
VKKLIFFHLLPDFCYDAAVDTIPTYFLKYEKIYPDYCNHISGCIWIVIWKSNAQSVLNPADSVYTYDSTTHHSTALWPKSGNGCVPAVCPGTLTDSKLIFKRRGFPA